MHRRGGGFAVVRVEQHAVGQDLDALGDALELAIERWSRVNRKAEFEHLAGRVLVDQATRRPGRDDLRLVHHDQPVAQLLGLVHVVRGQDDGHALLLEPVKAIPNQVPRLRVEAGRGLVEQEKAGLVDERTGDREPSFHATGEGLDFVFGAVLELDELEQLLRAGSRDVTRNIEVAGVGEQVFVDPEFHVERVAWGTTPSLARIRGPSITGSRPSTRSSPPDGDETQPIMRIVDVLPAPFGPRKPNASPRWTSKSIASTATSLSKRLVRPRAWTSASARVADAAMVSNRYCNPHPEMKAPLLARGTEMRQVPALRGRATTA